MPTIDEGQLEPPWGEEDRESSLAAHFRLPEDLGQRFLDQHTLNGKLPFPALFGRAIMTYIQEQGYLDSLLGTAPSYLQLKIRQFLKQVVEIETLKTYRMNPKDFYAGYILPNIKALQFVLRDAFRYLETVMDHNKQMQEVMKTMDELQQKHGEVEGEREAFRARIEELSADAATDPLTGLQNRKVMERKIEKVALENPEEPYVYMIFDLDRFKQINDDYGHSAGDEAITHLAELVSTLGGIRYEDIVRLGGDEFVVLFPNMDGRGLATANHIRRLVEGFEFAVKDNEGRVHSVKRTVSIGVVFCNGKDLANKGAYYKADRALQLAKGKKFDAEGNLIKGEEDLTGRNRLWVFGRRGPEDRDVPDSFEFTPGK